MKNQLTFTDLEYSSRKRTTRREEFLDTMDSIIPYRGLNKLDTHLRMLAVSANFYMASRSTLCELPISVEG